MSAIIVITQFDGGWEWRGKFDNVYDAFGHSFTLIGLLDSIKRWAEPIEKEIEAWQEND